MQKYLKYLPNALFFAYLIKVLVISTSMSDALIVLCLTLLTAFYEYRVKDSQIKAFETHLQILLTKMSKFESDMEAVRGNISSVKLSQGMRTIKNVKID